MKTEPLCIGNALLEEVLISVYAHNFEYAIFARFSYLNVFRAKNQSNQIILWPNVQTTVILD